MLVVEGWLHLTVGLVGAPLSPQILVIDWLFSFLASPSGVVSPVIHVNISQWLMWTTRKLVLIFTSDSLQLFCSRYRPIRCGRSLRSIIIEYLLIQLVRAFRVRSPQHRFALGLGSVWVTVSYLISGGCRNFRLPRDRSQKSCRKPPVVILPLATTVNSRAW